MNFKLNIGLNQIDIDYRGHHWKGTAIYYFQFSTKTFVIIDQNVFLKSTERLED
jgi:hypothetical protein